MLPLARVRVELCSAARTRQLANHLQVTTRCLANWRKEGRIPFWRLTARALRYELSAVERALSKPNFEE